MKEKYYVKEFASMLNISTETLRYYDKLGLLKPAEINNENNYRMYSLVQIWPLERIRYLQTLGLNLDEIKTAINSDDISGFVQMLETKYKETVLEINRLESIRTCIKDYINYYHYNKQLDLLDFPYRTSWGKRYILTEKYRPDEALIGTAGPRLLIKKAKSEFASITFLRQIGFLLDYDSLRQGKFQPTHYFILIKGNPSIEHPDIFEVPAGSFICIRGKILAENHQINIPQQLLTGDMFPKYALALECEDDLDTSSEAFIESQFEVQILL